MFDVVKTPFEIADAYKLSHLAQYPKGTSGVYANLTPRKSRNPKIDKFVFFGLQVFLKDLNQVFAEKFFELDRATAVANFDSFYTEFFGVPNEYSNIQIGLLHDLGFLPLRIKALPEGSVVSHGIPVLTLTGTHDDFFWLSQSIETWLSLTIWKPSTSATIAFYYRRLLDKYAAETSDQGWFVDYQAHDFSERGMANLADASASGAGHILSFRGSDTCPVINWVKKYYPPTTNALLATSIPASEHSIMCAQAAVRAAKYTHVTEEFDESRQIWIPISFDVRDDSV